ncbi:uncharacterized protein MAM_05327 [Metarhizium album ARSEF 1941]|uniref:DUF7492 domain-containing protein n=1 Tax=Metarhizium album (strain ARSEF 1941) TaxID=1081103 RepID=A0A0B2WL57_METAS|nr:uncharacterized protein MAM_05327 [Metarhizium album ARSEF 1941]KHN96771.1 hypothetical protein MAM_05327 [Metarhizium album ARSEF 1941]
MGSLKSRRAKTSRLGSLLALACSASAHSWIEFASVIAPNGTMIGLLGYPRGYQPRSDAGWNDKIPQWLLPKPGSPAYSGDEVINKFPYEDKPKHPLLEAAPGDHIALVHFENGHVTLPQNQANKPKNRGTIYLYGTAQPKEKEKLFDVHLLWNRDGTGGDKRGTLLATRNYDDGQCFQPNTADITNQRVAKFKDNGATNSQELPCHSDLKLPDDLKPGSVYTIYWYWDWPTLNPSKIDMDKTTDGLYPWAGSFMRGDKVPNGWTMEAIGHNESYASVIDIKVVEKPKAFAGKDAGKEAWVPKQNIYSMGVQDQMANNFQVDVGGGAAAATNSGTGSAPASAPAPAPAPASTSAPAAAGSAKTDGVATVTEVITVPPTTLVTTVFRTVCDSDHKMVRRSEPAPPQPATHLTAGACFFVTADPVSGTGALPTGTFSAAKPVSTAAYDRRWVGRFRA